MAALSYDYYLRFNSMYSVTMMSVLFCVLSAVALCAVCITAVWYLQRRALIRRASKRCAARGTESDTVSLRGYLKDIEWFDGL